MHVREVRVDERLLRRLRDGGERDLPGGGGAIPNGRHHDLAALGLCEYNFRALKMMETGRRMDKKEKEKGEIVREGGW
jgi:hypothetical protein